MITTTTEPFDDRRASYTLVMLAPFPPPLHGASKNTKIIHDELRAIGGVIVALTTSGRGISHVRGPFYHLDRIWRNLVCLIKLVGNARKQSILYVVPDGGRGIAYSTFHILIAAALYRKIFIHHRTYNYVRSHSPLMAKIVGATEKVGVHIFLSKGMEAEFSRRYGTVRYLVASNARFVESYEPDLIGCGGASDFAVGYLSNLCEEKGFYIAADIADRLLEDTKYSFHIGGPALEKGVQKRLDDLCAKWPSRFFYHGPLYGIAKSSFYASLDTFIFPTIYAQEAQPNVIYEALSAGLPVISTATGCIPEMLANELLGVSISPENDFSPEAIKLIHRWQDSAIGRLERKNTIVEEFQRLRQLSAEQYSCLYQELIPLLGSESP